MLRHWKYTWLNRTNRKIGPKHLLMHLEHNSTRNKIYIYNVYIWYVYVYIEEIGGFHCKEIPSCLFSELLVFGVVVFQKCVTENCRHQVVATRDPCLYVKGILFLNVYVVNIVTAYANIGICLNKETIKNARNTHSLRKMGLYLFR